MILEIATLDVKSGEEQDFEESFNQARAIIAQMPGYVSHQLHRCVETTNRYVLLLNWERLEDHTEGFRNSAQYQQWKALLHHFYEPFPTVEHFQELPALSSTHS